MSSGFRLYRTYLAVKNHFQTESYDYFRYKGKVSATEHSFDRRRDKIMFSRLARKLPEKEWLPFLVSNFAMKKNVWVGDLLSPAATITYMEMCKKLQAFDYFFEQDCNTLCKNICESGEDFNTFFTATPGKYPKVIELYLSDSISLETVWVLDSILQLQESYDRTMRGNIVWDELKALLNKYGVFLEAWLETEKHKYRCRLRERTEYHGIKR